MTAVLPRAEAVDATGFEVKRQSPIPVRERDAENGNVQACREFGMSFMAYGSLGRGGHRCGHRALRGCRPCCLT